ncbi:MAG: GtrA family protein, partial [Pseudomonadota bacterium]
MSVAGKKQIASFTLVGIIGFAVDAAMLQLALSSLQLEPVRARLVSFPVAVVVTWMLHRQFTFAHRRSERRSTE